MAVALVLRWALVLALGLGPCQARPHHGGDDLVEKIWGAVEAGLQFLTYDYSSINVDGLFGIRVGQGQIQEVIQAMEKNDTYPKKTALLERLRHVDSSLNSAAEGAMPYIEAQDKKYFSRFQHIIARPYRLRYRSHQFDDISGIQIGDNVGYNETKGDECFSRIMGSYTENGRTLPKCNITHSCLEMMTRSKTTMYFVTHQLLYFIMLEQVGCNDELSKFKDNSMSESACHIKDRLCAQIYKEALEEVLEKNVEYYIRDLFLEQTMLCGSLGYRDFVKPEWMQMVVSWQSREGCFKTPEYLEDLAKSLDQQLEAQSTPTVPRQTRSLLVERKMKGGCLSHMTGLGFGSLCLYLRVLLDSSHL